MNTMDLPLIIIVKNVEMNLKMNVMICTCNVESYA